jgi:phosphoribosylaminoimidazole-succinocarboxamide synthase
MTPDRRDSINTRIREGKAKILYSTNSPDEIITYFKDDATAFNAQKKGQIRNKGCINNQVTAWIFQYLHQKGIPTHFIKQISDREMLVRRVDIIPVEMVIRNRAAGSICKRLGLPKGETFTPPLLEYFYKSDELGDPLIGETHIFHFKWSSREDLATASAMTFRINEILKEVFHEIGLELIDFKLEFGRDPQGKVVLADEFTPDGCRLWDYKTGESKDKDRFRQDLGGVDEAYEEVFQRLKTHFEEKL